MTASIRSFFKMKRNHYLLISLVIFLPEISHGMLQRCYTCRSRGELGSCKDPFVADQHVQQGPCASGWCGKILETENVLREEYGSATQRTCFQRGPSDNEERCAYTELHNQKVYMCFCKGDLCNTSTSLASSFAIVVLLLAVTRLIL